VASSAGAKLGHTLLPLSIDKYKDKSVDAYNGNVGESARRKGMFRSPALQPSASVLQYVCIMFKKTVKTIMHYEFCTHLRTVVI
jgi:hypothetical protein